MGLIQTITKNTLKETLIHYSEINDVSDSSKRIEKVQKTQLVISLIDENNMPNYTLFYDYKPQRKLTIDEVITDKFDIYQKKKITPDNMKRIILTLSNIYEQTINNTRLLICADQISSSGKEIKKLKIWLLNGGYKVKELTFDDILPNM